MTTAKKPVEPVVEETPHVYGATSNVDRTELVYDETAECWVTAEAHEIWQGGTPKSEEESPPSLTTDMFMQFIAASPGQKLNVRVKPSLSSKIVTNIPHNTKLRVLDNSNPKWVEVELTNIAYAGSGARGFVKRTFVTELPESE